MKFLGTLLINMHFTLLYRASEDGWHAKDFHKLCDKSGPTMTLFQVEGGDCIGGYTKKSWEGLK